MPVLAVSGGLVSFGMRDSGLQGIVSLSGFSSFDAEFDERFPGSTVVPGGALGGGGGGAFARA